MFKDFCFRKHIVSIIYVDFLYDLLKCSLRIYTVLPEAVEPGLTINK